MGNFISSERFPRTSKYHPDWIKAGVSGGANPLWLSEWLCGAVRLQPGMRVLDLSCGRAMSSIFLHREFGVQVWAADLWFNPSENFQRVRDAGAEQGVFPLRADARALPFAAEFFDAIISIDSFFYYGTDDLFLPSLLRFLKTGGVLGIAGAGLMQELDGAVPEHLCDWWEPTLWCLHSAPWWQRHWQKSGFVDVELADSMPDGWQAWLEWQRAIWEGNELEIKAVEADQGRNLGYIRVVGRRRADAKIPEPIVSVPTEYARQPLLRESCG